MKFACHYGLCDSHYLTYSVYAHDLYDLEDLENVPVAGFIRKVDPQGYGGPPFLGVVDT